MSALRKQVIKLASENPELRRHLLPLLRLAGCEKLPEGGMRDNCEKKVGEGKGKTAAKKPLVVSGWELWGDSDRFTLRDSEGLYVADGHVQNDKLIFKGKTLSVDLPDKPTQQAMVKALSKTATLAVTAAKADKKVTGKKLDSLISSTYYKHGNGIVINMMSIPKIYREAEKAYGDAATHADGVEAVEKAMKAAIVKYKVVD